MIINISQYNLYKECPTKWYDRYVLKRETEVEAEPLLSGTMLHVGFDRFFSMDPGERRILAIEAMTEFYEVSVKLLTSEKKQKEFKINLGRWTVAMELWQEKYPDMRTIAIEHVLEMPIGEHQLVGRLDRVVEWHDKLYHMQHRSLNKGTTIDLYLKMSELSPHELGYNALMLHNYPDQDSVGTMFNIVRKVGEDYMRTRTDDAIRQDIVTADPDLVLDFLHDLEIDAAVMQKIVDGNLDLLTKNRKACGGIYGNSLCPYFNVCSQRTTIFDDALYRDVPESYLDRMQDA